VSLAATRYIRTASFGVAQDDAGREKFRVDISRGEFNRGLRSPITSAMPIGVAVVARHGLRSFQEAIFGDSEK